MEMSDQREPCPKCGIWFYKDGNTLCPTCDSRQFEDHSVECRILRMRLGKQRKLAEAFEHKS